MGLDLSRRVIKAGWLRTGLWNNWEAFMQLETSPDSAIKAEQSPRESFHSCTIAKGTNPLFLLQVIAYQTYGKKPSTTCLRLGQGYWYIPGAVTIRTHYPEPNVAIQYHQSSSSEQGLKASGKRNNRITKYSQWLTSILPPLYKPCCWRL